MMNTVYVRGVALALVLAAAPAAASGQQTPMTPPATALPVAAPPAGVPLPANYVIGPEDVLSVLYWREKDMSADVVVRPDGMITLPLLNEVQAAGLTPDELRGVVTKGAVRFVAEPSVTIVVKAINSRRVFITGQVAKSGAYPLTSSMNVVQLIAIAGGLLEFADSEGIVVMRTENGRQVAHRVNYKDLQKRKNLKQNIDLRPGDTVIVP